MSRTVRTLTKNSLCSGCLSCMSTYSLTNERYSSLSSARGSLTSGWSHSAFGSQATAGRPAHPQHRLAHQCIPLSQ